CQSRLAQSVSPAPSVLGSGAAHGLSNHRCLMAAGDGAQLPATVAASRSVEKALEEAASSGALILSNRKLKEFPRTAKNYDLSDVTHAGKT
uniref:Uncharacterized protein n=1 Tax=Sinocyclocheilus grahami TaxID=75366 RepID=A0A672MXE9_SINGR